MPGIDLPRVGEVVFGQVDYAAGGTFGPRIQRNLQLVVLDRGSVTVTTDGRRRRLGPGEVVGQWPGGQEHYAFDEQTSSSHRWVALTLEDPGGGWVEAAKHLWPAVVRETEAMREIFALGWSGLEAEGGTPALRRALGMAYATAFAAAGVDAGSVPGLVDPRLPRPLLEMRRVIEARYAGPLELADLAEAASVTPAHLVRLCRKHLDTTPIRLLWGSRLDRGIDLVKHTGLDVAEIAYRVGFASPFHFSRKFKEKVGVAPSEQRRREWGNGGGSGGLGGTKTNGGA